MSHYTTEKHNDCKKKMHPLTVLGFKHLNLLHSYVERSDLISFQKDFNPTSVLQKHTAQMTPYSYGGSESRISLSNRWIVGSNRSIRLSHCVFEQNTCTLPVGGGQGACFWSVCPRGVMATV